MSERIVVKAIWDDEANVWVATSDDVPGLVVEAATTDELEAELIIVVPQLLILQDSNKRFKDIPIDLYQESHFVAAMA